MADNPYLAGNFAPVFTEVTATDLPVTGSIPEALHGRYVRIGPNPVTAPDPSAYHWFTGEGMVHGVRLRDGRAEWYRNRWVRSTRVTEALGEPPTPGPRHGMGDGANTNVIALGGRTYALVEAGNRPVELSWDLATVAVSDFGGTLPNGFAAHPKRDPDTGELHAACYYWEIPGIQHVVVGADARVRRVEPIAVKGSPMMHDMSLTRRHVVFYDLPVVFNMEAAMNGARFPYLWDDAYGARVGVMPRDGGSADVRWFEIAPCYVFHPLNAYDDGDRVVLDVVRHPRMFASDTRGPHDGPPVLWRWTVDLAAGKVHEEQRDDHPEEFPRVDDRLVGKPHRFGYATGLDPSRPGFGVTRTLLRHDLEKGTTQTHDFGPGAGTGEAVFVPRTPDAAEDDGWVLSFVYRRDTDRSDLVILDAGNFSGPPVAVVHLPQRLPYGFHGNWLED
jgi:carotenoid cleavage dioxygenase